MQGPINDVDVEIQDGALGISGPSPDSLHVKVGPAAGGVVGQLYTFTSAKQVKDTLIAGPLAEACAFHLAKGGTVLAMVAAASTAGTNSAVTATKTGTATGALSGAPNDRYDIKLEITRGGATLVAGTAAFKYSLDGGDNYSPEIAMPVGGVYALPGTGLTVTFTYTTGTAFVAGDKFTWTTTAPQMTTTDLNNAITALFAYPTEWVICHVLGASTPSIAAAVATRADEAEANARYVRFILQARDIDATTDSGSEDTWINNLKTEWAAFAHARVAVVAGHSEVISQLTGRQDRRSDALAAVQRIMSIEVHKHPGEVDAGPVSGVAVLGHDERVKPGLDAARFMTLRTFTGLQGIYVTNGRMMAAAGSDFGHIQVCRVLDKACRIARLQTLRLLNSDVEIDGTGNILEREAANIDAKVKGILESEIVDTKNASAVAYRLDRASNILSTGRTTADVRIRPKGYLTSIGLKIGLTNPKLGT